MSKVTVLDKSGQLDFNKSVSKLTTKDLMLGVSYENYNNKSCHAFGVKNNYKVIVYMGLFDDIEINFGTLSEVKSYIKKEIKK